MDIKELLLPKLDKENEIHLSISTRNNHTRYVVSSYEISDIIWILQENNVSENLWFSSSLMEPVMLSLDGHVFKRQLEGYSNKSWGYSLDALKTLCKKYKVTLTTTKEDCFYDLDKDMKVDKIYGG